MRLRPAAIAAKMSARRSCRRLTEPLEQREARAKMRHRQTLSQRPETVDQNDFLSSGGAYTALLASQSLGLSVAVSMLRAVVSNAVYAACWPCSNNTFQGFTPSIICFCLVLYGLSPYLPAVYWHLPKVVAIASARRLLTRDCYQLLSCIPKSQQCRCCSNIFACLSGVSSTPKHPNDSNMLKHVLESLQLSGTCFASAFPLALMFGEPI